MNLDDCFLDLKNFRFVFWFERFCSDNYAQNLALECVCKRFSIDFE